MCAVLTGDLDRDRVNVVGRHLAGAGLRRGDGGNGSPAADFDHFPVPHEIRLIEKKAGKDLGRRPDHRPERHRTFLSGFLFPCLPEGENRLGASGLDLRAAGHRTKGAEFVQELRGRHGG